MLLLRCYGYGVLFLRGHLATWNEPHAIHPLRVMLVMLWYLQCNTPVSTSTRAKEKPQVYFALGLEVRRWILLALLAEPDHVDEPVGYSVSESVVGIEGLEFLDEKLEYVLLRYVVVGEH